MRLSRGWALAAAAGATTVAMLAPVAPTASADPSPLPPLSLTDTDFYEAPSPLPEGEPGDVIRTRELPLSLYPSARARQIMYLSTNTHGERVPVTGLLLVPISQGPGDDNPVVVVPPGTRGLADKCAPSRQADPLQVNLLSPDPEVLGFQMLLLRGVSVVITDFEGRTTAGDHPYLVGPSEGYGTLDALRAAQQIPSAGLSNESPVGVFGYSQGGHGAAWAAEVQPDYAPELDLRAVLAGGVPTDMLVQVNHLNGNPTAGAGFALAALVGLDVAYPDLHLEKLLTAQGQQVIERVKNSCYLELLAGFGTTSAADVTEPNVLADPKWQRRFGESLLGTTAPDVPVYLYHGTLDTIVPLSQGQQLFHDWCAEGADVSFDALSGLEHVSGAVVGPWRGVQWLVDRLNGSPAPDGCREIGLLDGQG